MEYAKDEVFQIRYNTKLNRLEMREESLINRLVKKVKRHKLITIVMVVLVLLTVADVVMISSFAKVLQNF